MAELSKAIARLMEQRERERSQPDNGGPEARDVVSRSRAHIPPGERSLAENFVRHFLEATATDEVEHAELRLLAMVAFRFAMEREGDEPRIRVFDPNLAEDGWESSGSVVHILMRDRPFVVDTVRLTLSEDGSPARRLLHPVFGIERDQRHAVLAVGPPAAVGPKEIFIHAEVERLPEPQAVAALLHERLQQLMAATDEYPSMRLRLESLVEGLDAKTLPRPWNTDAGEAKAFLQWLDAGNFVFLGYREYQLAGQGAQRTAAVRGGTGLGLLRETERSSFATPQRLGDPLRHRLNEPPLLMITKTNAESTVHRRAHMDYIGVKEVDNAGVVTAERRFIGLFTKRAYAAESATIPLLRRKLDAVCELDGAAEGSSEAAGIRSIFNTIPKVELFALSPADVHAEVTEIRSARGSTELRVSSRADVIGRGVFVLVIMPRERFSADVRGRLEERLVRILQASAILEREVVTSDSGQVRLHFYLAASPENLRMLGGEDLLSEVADLMRSWDDRLRQELTNRFADGRGRELAARYLAALPRSYKESTDTAQAAEDIRCIEALHKEHGAHLELIDLGAKAERRALLRLYQIGESLALGNLIDGLVNFGLRVVSVHRQELALPDLGAVYIYSFDVERTDGEAIDTGTVAPLLRSALLRLRAGLLENDALNALVVSAALQWEHVEVLRAYVNYGVAVGLAPSRETLIAALNANADAARLLWRYFEARFDPADGTAARDREQGILPSLERDFHQALDPTRHPYDAGLLSRLFAAVGATVRTNCFVPPQSAPGAAGRAALSFKIDGGKLPPLPGPRPAYELYVDSLTVRGLLLCSGRTARATLQAYGDGDGLRAELLEQLPGETVSDFVSTPDAAVGGWAVLHRGTSAPTPAQSEGALRTYLSALLDVTDNVERGRITPAPGVIAYDELSPVLTVVARDRGAEIAKVANRLAEERDFWLGDAFAAGQAHTLEHHKASAAARGAWESARWHFFEAGEDPHARAITVAGVGDMSDAAFGTGVLQSRQFKLLAAFSDQHIFLDPNPDVSRSFAERERLFNLPRSTWADYDRQLLSDGGGVYSRTTASIPLSDPVRRMLGFGVTQEVATPTEIVGAILSMNIDLLWLGGGGVVVRAGGEPVLRDAGPTPAGTPVAATDIKAKIIAEPRPGAVTQRGRIEYGQRGGRINTAAVDAAAGIDLADHEVNFKLALGAAVEGGHLTAADRAQILEETKPQAMAAVLARSLAHARAITLDQRRSQTQIDDFRHLGSQLAAAGLVARGELLPDWELSAGRRGPWGGLSRPELADLLALTKRWLQRRILASGVPDDSFFEPYLRDYFPDSLNQRCGQQIRSHKLRREIVAAELARRIVESMGVTFVSRLSREAGVDADAVVRAWAVAVEIAGALDLWDEVGNANPPLPLRGELACWEWLSRGIESATRWVLQTQPPEATAGGVFEMFAEPARELLKALSRLLPAGQIARINERVGALAREGLPRALPERIVPLDSLADMLDIVEIAAEHGLEREAVVELYYEIGDLLDLDWVRDRIADLPADSRWERRARNSLNEGLLQVRKELTRRILLSREEGRPIRAALEEYLVAHQEQLTRLGELIDDITSAQRPSLAALLVIVREFGRLVDHLA
jgi:glutamate dehydrogenase